MLELIFSSTMSESLTFGTTLLVVFSSLALGLCISAVYMLTHKNEEYNASFVVTLIMLPAIIAMIIYLIGNNVARAFSLAGAFSLIRFRSAAGDPKDIAYVFFTLGVGLACGMGYIGYAALFAAILCAVMTVLTLLNYGSRHSGPLRLRIVIPEDMDYNNAFDETLREYTASYRCVRVKTTDFGSLFEITYDITMKDIADSKAFIDKLRSKNGNLNITLSLREAFEAATF